ncbi:MAG: hypothetical protein KME15_19290 [Drouetiella hepatica Uher 2000/2452]|jgi:hypothetical protein|uniref:Lipoprotein n=1 Tax=Drouetiella hepatica Uher 2000/2452 TaxID=904376 RepID=A0A951QE20_9CYAN|nr:hypothetical protein [Drouetiella hepatica Uher 2000/2452]
MKLRRVAYLLTALGLAVLTACTRPWQEATPSASASASVGGVADHSRPDARILPVNVEGKLTEIELKLFDQPPLPFTTYVPVKDFTSEVGSSEEGTGVRFYYSLKGVKNDKAYIHIFLPTQAISVEEMQDLLIGDGGLMASNGWELSDRTDIVSYGWAKEKLIYQQRTPTQLFMGSIYVGEQNRRAFYAFTHYPVEIRNAFEPRSTVVLESLQFKAQN